MTSTVPTSTVEDELAPYGGVGQRRFERVVALAKELFDVPAAAVNIVGTEMLVPLAVAGTELDPFPREVSFCSRAVDGEGQLLVADAAQDRRFADNPLVTEDPHLRFYAGQPLTSGGERVGTLCLFGSEPRELDARESRMLRDLGSWVENELAVDHSAREAEGAQRRLLPSRPVDMPGFGVGGRCAPARGVGGDVYDWIALDDGCQVVLCDVMGKGVPAAMTAAGVRAVLRGASPFNSLENTMLRVDKAVADDLGSAGSFVTLFLARVGAEGQVGWIDAGHGLAAIVGPDGRARRLSSTGLPVGVLPDDSWECHTEHLAPGEALVVVSDGVVDNYTDLEHAERMLVPLITAHTEAQQIADTIVDHALVLAPPRGSRDDITALVIRRDDA
ncbi:SpoIIE family protein phosphatase [Nocardioidaceae bacterium]|nr:SpoIIE family protein phosphatase [Nocardioidaceae bacterium]